MSDGAVLLKDYPLSKIVMACDRCDRGGRYDKAALIERLGGETRLPSLRLEIAAAWGCEIAKAQLANQSMPGFRTCRAGFADLVRLKQSQTDEEPHQP
jgi:hypothetical protein